MSGTDKQLAALLTWCQVERGKLGAVDGYNYKSGEEYGIRRVVGLIVHVIALDNRLTRLERKLSRRGDE